MTECSECFFDVVAVLRHDAAKMQHDSQTTWATSPGRYDEMSLDTYLDKEQTPFKMSCSVFTLSELAICSSGQLTRNRGG
jgi:hypothetical protein